MKYYVGVTDRRWFEYLKGLKPDEANFWRPSASGGSFRAIQLGAPFLFKLHTPNDYIVGGGFFSGYWTLPLRTAWETFGTRNGADTFAELSNAIAGYRARRGQASQDPDIGCIVLSQPFFFDRQDWIPAPADWSKNLVRGKAYESTDAAGAILWNEVATRLYGKPLSGRIREATDAEGPVIGKPYLRTARLGQGGFRLMTLENYGRRCCITGESTLPVLEAAHIRPVAEHGNHSLRNGLLMRADMHILYDRGLLAVDPDYRIRISPKIREQYLNGRVYYAHDGELLRSLPREPDLRPDRNLLEWHMEKVFDR